MDNFKVSKIKAITQLTELYVKEKPKIVGCDTESTGLHIMRDKPFVITLGWVNLENKVIYVGSFDLEQDYIAVRSLFDKFSRDDVTIVAWNVKYDMHMLANIEFDVMQNKWFDGIALVRLTTASDSNMKLGLKPVASKYFGEESSALDKLVKTILTQLRKDRFKKIDAELKQYGLDTKEILKMYENQEYLEDIDDIISKYPEPNYSDVPREIMLDYADNDVVIMLKYLVLATPYINLRDQQKILQEETALIKPLWEKERTGLKVDIQYLEESKQRVKGYLDFLREKLHNLAGTTFTVSGDTL